MEDDISQPWVCEETDPFTLRICYFDFAKTLMPSHIKTYDESEDSKDHLKIFQAAAKTERNLQHQAKKWGIHGRIYGRYKLECRDVKGAPKCMKIFGFMHRIINPELIKRLHDKIPQSIDEMMSVTTAFLRGEMAASNGEWKNSFTSWKQETGQKQNFKRGNLRNEQRFERKQDRFTLLTKTPREILALDKGKLKPPLPMITPIEQRNASKFCWKALTFDQGVKAKQRERSGKDSKEGRNLLKRQTAGNIDGATMAKNSEAKDHSNFLPGISNFFPALTEEDGTEGLMIIEAEMGGHCVHRIYVDGGSSFEILMLTRKAKEKEELIIYMAATKEAISAVLMTERDGKQVPIYFVSRALQGPEVNYTPMENLILALHDIQYRPRTSVKGQILADFIMECPEDGTPDTPMEDRKELLDLWILFTDGASCVDGSGAGLIIMNPDRMEFTYALRFRFNATNNEAEYEALIAGLRIASQMGIQNLQANVDLKLVANQVNGIYIAKESSMQIPRGENKKADALSKITSTSFAHLSKQVLVEELGEKAIEEKEILAVVEEEGHTWMTPFYEYLTEGVLPEEKKKARTVRRKAGRYAVTSKVLYKKSFLGPWLRCVGPLQANYVLREIHEGSCSMHAGPRSVVAKALRFRLPGEVISNNEKQFRDNSFKDWCEKLNIRQCFGSVKHPQANGLVERANRSLGEGIKSSNGETPFSLTYGTEAVIPAKIGMPTLRTVEVDVNKNNEALGISLDLLEEKREQAAIQEARSKARMERYYNARVRSTNFCPGDLVYQNNEASHAEDEGKLGPK
nr:reverse transcriptase domain-containing protein [Tanacetum cinerariifolium]